MKKNTFWGSLIGIFTMFSITEAANTGENVCAKSDMSNVTGIINWASCLLYKTVIPLLFALGTAGFIYGIVQFYLNPDNEEKRKKGKAFIVGGLIALFVMVSMWGIVYIFTNTFGFTNTIPQLPGQ